MDATVIIAMQFSQHLAADDCFIALVFLKFYYFSMKVAENNCLNATLTLTGTIKWKRELKESGLGTQNNPGIHLICYLSGAVHLCMLTNCATGLGLLVIGFQRKHFLSGISIINSVWTHP